MSNATTPVWSLRERRHDPTIDRACTCCEDGHAVASPSAKQQVHLYCASCSLCPQLRFVSRRRYGGQRRLSTPTANSSPGYRQPAFSSPGIQQVRALFASITHASRAKYAPPSSSPLDASATRARSQHVTKTNAPATEDSTEPVEGDYGDWFATPTMPAASTTPSNAMGAQQTLSQLSSRPQHSSAIEALRSVLLPSREAIDEPRSTALRHAHHVDSNRHHVSNGASGETWGGALEQAHGRSGSHQHIGHTMDPPQSSPHDTSHRYRSNPSSSVVRSPPPGSPPPPPPPATQGLSPDQTRSLQHSTHQHRHRHMRARTRTRSRTRTRTHTRSRTRSRTRTHSQSRTRSGTRTRSRSRTRSRRPRHRGRDTEKVQGGEEDAHDQLPSDKHSDGEHEEPRELTTEERVTAAEDRMNGVRVPCAVLHVRSLHACLAHHTWTQAVGLLDQVLSQASALVPLVQRQETSAREFHRSRTRDQHERSRHRSRHKRSSSRHRRHTDNRARRNGHKRSPRPRAAATGEADHGKDDLVALRQHDSVPSTKQDSNTRSGGVNEAGGTGGPKHLLGDGSSIPDNAETTAAFEVTPGAADAESFSSKQSAEQSDVQEAVLAKPSTPLLGSGDGDVTPCFVRARTDSACSAEPTLEDGAQPPRTTTSSTPAPPLSAAPVQSTPPTSFAPPAPPALPIASPPPVAPTPPVVPAPPVAPAPPAVPPLVSGTETMDGSRAEVVPSSSRQPPSSAVKATHTRKRHALSKFAKLGAATLPTAVAKERHARATRKLAAKAALPASASPPRQSRHQVTRTKPGPGAQTMASKNAFSRSSNSIPGFTRGGARSLNRSTPPSVRTNKASKVVVPGKRLARRKFSLLLPEEVVLPAMRPKPKSEQPTVNRNTAKGRAAALASHKHRPPSSPGLTAGLSPGTYVYNSSEAPPDKATPRERGEHESSLDMFRRMNRRQQA